MGKLKVMIIMVLSKRLRRFYKDEKINATTPYVFSDFNWM